MKLKSINDINPTFENFGFNWNEEYSYGKQALKKYSDEVVSFRITEKSCYILLKSKRKFFGFRFVLEEKRVKRIKDEKIDIFVKNKGVVLDKKKFKLFTKEIILKNL